MADRVEDVFSCDRCTNEERCPRTDDETPKTELPRGWLRLDLYEGDQEGIAQDHEETISKHYCPKCKGVVEKFLGPMPT